MNVSGFSSSGVSSNGLVGSSGSGISATANPWAVPKPNVRTIGSTSTTPLCTGTTTSTTAAPSTEAMDVSTFLQRERDYKSALYLLQEELLLLRSQVAGFEAAKRSIRGTPKKKTVNTSFAQVVA